MNLHDFLGGTGGGLSGWFNPAGMFLDRFRGGSGGGGNGYSGSWNHPEMLGQLGNPAPDGGGVYNPSPTDGGGVYNPQPTTFAGYQPGGLTGMYRSMYGRRW